MKIKTDMDVYIKGMADAQKDKGVSAFSIKKGKEEIAREFWQHHGHIRTKNLDFSILEYGQKCQYLTELWALNFAFTRITDQTRVTVYTNSVVIASWINSRECKEDYTGLFSVFLDLSKNMAVKAVQVNLNSGGTLYSLRHEAMTLLNS